MARCLSSKRLRWVLWKSTNGKCAICGRDLGDDWEADHKVPYSEIKKTNVHEMQPLCKKCNRKKGART